MRERKGEWYKKGYKSNQTGTWRYCWSSQRFYIFLDSKDPITGQRREITVSGDDPNFNGWKLKKE